MHKRIIVITGQRTSSTHHCEKIEHEQYIEYLGELGHTTHYPDIGASKSPREIFKYLQEKSSWVLKIIPNAVKMTLNTETVDTEKHELLKQYYVNMMRNKENTIVIPFNLTPAFYKDILFTSTEVYYLYRKDFKSQVKSMAIARITGNYYKFRNTDELQDQIVVPDEIILSTVDMLKNNWITIRELFQCCPGTVIALEDADQSKKYNQYQNVQGNFDLIQDFDVEQEVFGIKRGGHCTPHPSI